MMRGILYTLLYIATLAVACSCGSDVVYYSYRHTPLTGWERNDTLVYDVGVVKDAGTYNEEIGLRVSAEYPFTSVTLVVEQTVFPSRRVKSDTIRCEVYDRKGMAKGHGISTYQYMFPLSEISLAENDSFCVRIKHGMRREILSGIKDIGFRLSRK